MKNISSRQNPIVRAYRDLVNETDVEGTRVLLDGAHLVRDALAAGLAFESVAVAASCLTAESEEGDLARLLESAGAPVISVADNLLEAMSPVRAPTGIVAIAHRTPVDATAICGAGGRLTLVAVDVQDPGNLGALIRTAEAGGAGGVIVTGKSARPFSWKSLRGSMGSALRLPVAEAISVDDVLGCIHEGGGRSVASVPRGGHAPETIDWKGRVALLLGGEGGGLPAATIARCNDQVTIPMAAGVDSLNVAVAGAILIYAARRQRLQLDKGAAVIDSRRTP